MWECSRAASLRKIPAKLGVRGPHVHAHSLTIHTHAGPSNNPNVLFPAEAELSACLVVVVSFVVCGSRQRICFVNQISGCYWGTKRWPLFAFPAEPGHMLGLFPFLQSPGDENFLLHNSQHRRFLHINFMESRVFTSRQARADGAG